MMIISILSSFLLLFPDSADKVIDTRTWRPVEIVLKAKSRFANPYLEAVKPDGRPFLYAKFSCDDCVKNIEIDVPGFWDGNEVWKIRFSPPYPGTWRYITHSTDDQLNNKTGSVKVTGWTEEEKSKNPCRRGLITVNPSGKRAGRFFTYSDGTPFLWIGDTWWNWTKKEIPFEYYKNLVDTRAAQGFTIGQLFFPGNGWGSSASMLDMTYDHPDLEHIRKIEEMIRYANEKGITVWIHAWWSRDRLHETIGSEKLIRWWKYVVHRLHAYNVNWVLAGEYNMNDYGDLGLDFWNNLGRTVENEDPYERIIGTHPTPPGWDGGDEAPQWSTADVIHNQSWLKYNQSQVGHGKWRNEMIPEVIIKAYNMSPPKPIVVTEPWYEFVEGNPSAMDIRFGAWSALFSGAAGHTYGGGHIWRGHIPGSPSAGRPWPVEESFNVNTLNYPGARSMEFLSKFMHSINWWELEPFPELVSDNPSKFCLANPGKEYLVYLRYGGQVNIDLRNTSAQDEFHVDWIELASQDKIKNSIIKGGGVVQLNIPEDYPGVLEYKDWLIHLHR